MSGWGRSALAEGRRSARLSAGWWVVVALSALAAVRLRVLFACLFTVVAAWSRVLARFVCRVCPVCPVCPVGYLSAPAFVLFRRLCVFCLRWVFLFCLPWLPCLSCTVRLVGMACLVCLLACLPVCLPVCLARFVCVGRPACPVRPVGHACLVCPVCLVAPGPNARSSGALEQGHAAPRHCRTLMRQKCSKVVVLFWLRVQFVARRCCAPPAQARSLPVLGR